MSIIEVLLFAHVLFGFIATFFLVLCFRFLDSEIFLGRLLGGMIFAPIGIMCLLFAVRLPWKLS